MNPEDFIAPKAERAVTFQFPDDCTQHDVLNPVQSCLTSSALIPVNQPMWKHRYLFF